MRLRNVSAGVAIASVLTLAPLSAFAQQPLSPALAVVVPFIVLIVTLLFRPTGLFVPTPK